MAPIGDRFKAFWRVISPVRAADTTNGSPTWTESEPRPNSLLDGPNTVDEFSTTGSILTTAAPTVNLTPTPVTVTMFTDGQTPLHPEQSFEPISPSSHSATQQMGNEVDNDEDNLEYSSVTSGIAPSIRLQ